MNGRPAPGSQRALRAANRELVLRALGRGEAMTQAELARDTGLSAATVSNIVRELAGEGRVARQATTSSGRRAQAVRLAPRPGLAVGVDVGRRHLRVAVADLSRRVLAERSVGLTPGHRPGRSLADAAALVHELLSAAGHGAEVLGVGLGIPGPIDASTGAVSAGSILPEWVGVRPAEEFGRVLGLPVVADNDANLGALAETFWTDSPPGDDLVFIKVGSGIGAGIVLGGRLFRGHRGTAGEIGHTTLNENGAVCRCGNRGCLETVASTTIVLDLLAPQHPGLTVDGAIALAVSGDPAARRVVEDVGRAIGVATANLCNLVNPRIVSIGGPLSGAGELLLGPVRGALQRFAIPAVSQHTEVRLSELGERAEVLGALALVLEHHDQFTS